MTNNFIKFTQDDLANGTYYIKRVSDRQAFVVRYMEIGNEEPYEVATALVALTESYIEEYSKGYDNEAFGEELAEELSAIAYADEHKYERAVMLFCKHVGLGEMASGYIRDEWKWFKSATIAELYLADVALVHGFSL